MLTARQYSLWIVLVATGCVKGDLQMNRSSCENGGSGASCKVAATETVDASSKKLTATDCKNPDLSKVASGVKLTLCNGQEGVGTYVAASACTSTLTQGCLVSGDFRSALLTSIDASALQSGTSVSGVTGTMYPTKICRDGQGIKLDNGTSTTPWNGNWTSHAGTVAISPGSSAVTGTGTTFTTETGIDDYITIGTETRRITAIGNNLSITVDSNWTTTATGVAYTLTNTNSDLTVDDYQNGVSPTYLGSQGTNCNETNFTNVTGTKSDLVPDTTKDVNWTRIYQDNLSGVYFTNGLYINNKGWTEAASICKSLDGGTGGSGWKVPTVKEALQLHIDGAARVHSDFSTFANRYWSSTSQSANEGNGLDVRLGSPTVQTSTKGSLRSVFCIRTN